MDFRYCPDCGIKLTLRHISGRDVRYCTLCEKPRFGVSLPCVICLVVNELGELALIKQTYATKNNVCVAGFIEQGETAEQAALREVKEETGLEPIDAEYVASYYYAKNDDLMLGFAVRVKKAEFNVQADEVSSAAWYTVAQARSELEKGETGKELLRDWLNKTAKTL